VGLLSFFGIGKKSVSNAYDLYKELLGGNGSKSGQSVNWKTALQVSTAFACGRVISEGLAQVPFKLHRSRHNGKGSDPARDHPLYDLLYRNPNEWQTSFEFREQIGLHLAFKNNAYIYKVRGLRGEIVELLPYEPDMVRVVRDGWQRHYEIYIGKGEIARVDAQDIWHIRGPSWDGVLGMDVIRLMREAIGLAMATEEHGARMFSNGARPGGILTTDITIPKDQREEIREAWQSSYGGNVNAYKTAILYGGLKWQQMAMTGVDSQHLEQRRFQVEEVCRGFRVMPIMVGHYDKASTYASAEQMFLAHVVHTMMPWYERVEQSADVNLLSKEERTQHGLFSKFNVNGLMRGAAKDRAEFYAKLYSVGALSSNDIRELEEMNPYEGGDEYRVPMNTEVPGKTNTENEGSNNDNPAS
jgi:HK97 family phage portal protein